MLIELPRDQFYRLRPLLPQPCLHLAVESSLAGETPARAFVDQLFDPRSAMLWAGHHAYLAGELDDPDWQAELNHLITEPPPAQAGVEMLEVFPITLPTGPDGGSPGTGLPGPAIDAAFERILAGLDPLQDRREIYTGGTAEIAAQAEPALLPPGLRLAPVDRQLLAGERLGHLDELKDEMVSERPSVEDFLAKSFGVALVDEAANTLAGWCLSEYNLPGRCEVGIATAEAYQRRGLATAMGRALAAEAKERGIHTLGWHCFASNVASSATARKIGLKLAAVYPVYYFWYQPAVNLAVHGLQALREGRYAEALAWSTRSLGHAGAPPLADWSAGCACARLGKPAEAMQHLAGAIAKGFTDITIFETSPHLDSLRGEARWAALMESLL